MKIAIATCKTLPEPDADEELLLSALSARGARVRTLAWDGSDAPPDMDEVVVLRSTWNYFRDVERFLSWVDLIGQRTRLFNPAAVVRENAKKSYLVPLVERGIDVVPTVWVTPVRGHEVPRVEVLLRDRAWSAFVVKPVVSAGSFMTRRFEASDVDEAQRFLSELCLERDAMIQEWMPTVETYGERSLVYIDGEFTHAIRKSPRFAGGREAVSGAVPITASERAFAERVIAPLRGSVLYARVDMIEDAGTLRLMELELIEPSLFLGQCPEALERFADAIVARARR